MKKNRWFFPAALAALCGVLMTTAAMAADAGSAGDPLVTLSYLNETFLDAVLVRVDEKIASRNAQIAGQPGGGFGPGGVSTAPVFTVVTLSGGQTLLGDIGCEVMLRVGSAVCVSSTSPGLIDETSAAVLDNGGVLTRNHLYMMTIEDRGVRATAATTKLLVRGTYTIG